MVDMVQASALSRSHSAGVFSGRRSSRLGSDPVAAAGRVTGVPSPGQTPAERTWPRVDQHPITQGLRPRREPTRLPIGRRRSDLAASGIVRSVVLAPMPRSPGTALAAPASGPHRAEPRSSLGVRRRFVVLPQRSIRKLRLVTSAQPHGRHGRRSAPSLGANEGRPSPL